MLTNSNQSKLPTSIISIAHKQQHQQQQKQQLIKSNQPAISNSLQIQQKPNQNHIVPPRYQPPPQPHGGILKNIGTKTSLSYYSNELNAPHLNIKYPPDVPKLTNVFIPEGIKNLSNNQSKLIPPRATSLRFANGIGESAGTDNNPLNANNNLGQSHQQRLQTEEDLPFRVLQQQQQQQQQAQPQSTQQQTQDMLKFVRKPESEPSPTGNTISTNTNNLPGPRLSSDQNRYIQGLISELRALKEANQRLSDDNQELRDLCCFLDDDRQKGRKLAREWQRFGRYTASVMRQEVSAYQSKLRQLDDKQQELIRDNLELKELCLYLDEERANALSNSVCTNCANIRDDGDGSSSSTNADEGISNIGQFERNGTDINLRSTLSDQTVQYVRSLEKRIRQLEDEQLTIHNSNNNNSNSTIQHGNNLTNITTTVNTNEAFDPASGRPEAVVRALQVLEVREQLERERSDEIVSTTDQTMDDREKALVREMCNVVWRKLEDRSIGMPRVDRL